MSNKSHYYFFLCVLHCISIESSGNGKRGERENALTKMRSIKNMIEMLTVITERIKEMGGRGLKMRHVFFFMDPGEACTNRIKNFKMAVNTANEIIKHRWRFCNVLERLVGMVSDERRALSSRLNLRALDAF